MSWSHCQATIVFIAYTMKLQVTNTAETWEQGHTSSL